MLKKQATLVAFGFTKCASHHSKKTATEIPKFASPKLLKCRHCDENLNTQGLHDLHKAYTQQMQTKSCRKNNYS